MFALQAPAIDIPRYDLQPLVEVVADAPESSIVAQVRQVTEQVEKQLEPIRLESGAKIRAAIAEMLVAESNGWAIDCSAFLHVVDERMGELRASLKEAERMMRGLVSRAVGAHLPGAHTLNTYVHRIRSAAQSWLNDLEDYRDDVFMINKRMGAIRGSAPVNRSTVAYEAAIKEVFRAEPVRELQLDPGL